MSHMEVIFLILGIGTFVASFFIPDKKSKDVASIDMETVNALIDKQMQEAKVKVHEIVDETVEYAVEKTERASERISNEKIMAIDEYSQTVLSDVNKAHQEVMFLYDMLNDKQKNIKETVREAQNQANDVENKAKEASIVASKAKQEAIDAKNQANQILEQQMFSTTLIPSLKEKRKVEVFSFTKEAPKFEKNINNEFSEFKPLEIKKEEIIEPVQTVSQAADMEKAVSYIRLQDEETQDKKIDPVENNNDKILRMSREGKTSIEIAKELGLGVGEVKLVINLFKGAV